MAKINIRLEVLNAERRELLTLLAQEDQEGRGADAVPPSSIKMGAGEAISADDFFSALSQQPKEKRNQNLLIYIHVPFCSYKCTFCDWVADIPASRLTAQGDPQDRYVDALCRQIRHVAPRLNELDYVSKFIYWGGGTPTRLSSAHIERIVRTLEDSFDLSTVEEHSMETSPETLTLEKLQALKALGVARLSMGVQSFNSQELRRAGRKHSPEQATNAVGMMREAGFTQFNIDLIAALPEQKFEDLQRSIDSAVALDPAHLTVYIYRPTSTTAMTKLIREGRRAINGVEHITHSYDLVKQTLESAGYEEYTLGYFAKSRKYVCKSEEYYFTLAGDWVGFGSGAVSILGHHRLRNFHANFDQYVNDPLIFESCRDLKENKLECAAYALRQSIQTEAGIRYDTFRKFFGHSFEDLKRDSSIQELLTFYESCGARFIEDEVGLRISPESRRDAYIAAWHSGNPLR